MSELNSPIPTSTIEYYRPLPPSVRRRQRERYWLHALLLVATCFTTLVVGARMEFNFLHNFAAICLRRGVDFVLSFGMGDGASVASAAGYSFFGDAAIHLAGT